MNVRTKFAFAQYSKGVVLEVQPNVGRLWIQMGRCEEVIEPLPVVECAAAPLADFAPALAAEPSATGATIETLERPRKKHGR